MREILFRGQRLDTKQWEYGNYNNVNGKAYIFPEDAPDSYDNYQVDPATVGQYTGLQDMNGKRIFEGDIVKCNNKVEEYIGLVDWDMCNPSMCIRHKNKRGFDDVEYDFIICGNMTIEILGNVHDNPDTQTD